MHYIHTVHVTSYLQKSADFRGNSSRISVKVCAEICGLPWMSVQKFADFRESLCGNSQIVCGEPAESSFGIHRIVFQESTELSFGRLRICLVGVLQTIFGRSQVIKSAKSSSGVSEIVLWNRKSCINRCAISFERSAATLQRIIAQKRTESSWIPSNVSAYSLWWFCGRFTEVRKLLCGISWKTYAANPWNSITNLWHVLYIVFEYCLTHAGALGS